MIKRTVEKMAFDDVRDVMKWAYKYAKTDPQFAANFMQQEGCGHLIKKISNIPPDIIPEVAKVINIAKVTKAANAAKVTKNPYVVGVCIVGVAAVGGYLYFRKRKKRNIPTHDYF